jgi:hypothetical protein
VFAVCVIIVKLKNIFFCNVIIVTVNTCVCAGVPLQVKGVIEPLAAERAEVALAVAVTLHVAV